MNVSSHDEVRKDQNRYGRTLHVPRKNNGNKQVPKGHDAFLKALVASGAEIHVEKCSGDFVRGVLKHSDKYTLSVDDGNVTRVIFKHDISEFFAITPREKAESETAVRHEEDAHA